MTVTDASIASSLSTLTDSLNATASTLADAQDSLIPYPDGISLLDVKNELLLSYLQNLALLVLLKIRTIRGDTSEEPGDEEASQIVPQQIVQKLVELRVYLERGVRPLEGKLKYQIDQVLQAAENAKLSENAKHKASTRGPTTKGDMSTSDATEDEDEEGQDDSDEDEEPTAISQASPISGPRLQQQLSVKISQQRSTPQSKSISKSTTTTSSTPYRPPRLNPTSMPSDQTTRPQRKHHSQLLNEFIADELSSQPTAEPSIGATVTQSGRSTLSTRDRECEAERTAYEESHFTRLPGESKAERRQRKTIEEKMGLKRDLMGGEDWSGLGGLGDRVSRSVARGRDREKQNVLQRREKRRREREEGQRGDGMGESIGIGDKFNRKRAILEAREAKRRRR